MLILIKHLTEFGKEMIIKKLIVWLAFRKLVRQYECDLAFTPMIISDSFIKSLKARDSDFTTCKEDRPLIVQFAAKNGKEFADAAEIVVPYSDGVDLNCGCPQRWAMAEGYGACLIKKPELVKDMVNQAKSRVNNEDFTVSIKIRIHNDIRETVDMCQKAEKADSLQCPVIANGDINSLEDVQRIAELTGVNGVMAARGILQNPAMYSGYDNTPLDCVQKWLDISTSLGTHYRCFHNHLIYMLERVLPRAERRIFNALVSSSAVMDYLKEHLGI
ncbi:DUS4 [Mytilus edulis]|uniref:DUS4 n=1 Tax=Mytilus edulis TaxID=6550 RepID=A0A8S3VIN6_MYTED|nr:DUS4 [Mytilus edulis]